MYPILNALTKSEFLSRTAFLMLVKIGEYSYEYSYDKFLEKGSLAALFNATLFLC